MCLIVAADGTSIFITLCFGRLSDTTRKQKRWKKKTVPEVNNGWRQQLCRQYQEIRGHRVHLKACE
jgi:hypothetical protein